MCGIAGHLSFGSFAHDADGRDLARPFLDANAHRGPDGEGFVFDASAGALLAHRRLAIIDPTPDGAQPMAAADGRYQLVYNGELYNFRELRTELEQYGHDFRTRSDTEVVLVALIHWGPRAFERMRGMFAIALWDRQERSLLLARDRFGIKPLYFSSSSARVVFASEMGVLVRTGSVDPTPSPAGLLAYLSWGSIPPPLTWLDGVESLRPGHWRRWGANGTSAGGCFADIRERYVDDPARSAVRETEFRTAVGHAVEDSVRAHLVADVPVGVFLSGGIDSAALLSAARAAEVSDLRAFTVAFDEREYSEAPFAREVAAAFGAEHHLLSLSAGSVRADLPTILASLDQPSIDGINSYYVARAVAATGTKAVLSGAGGDELFGGYPSFRRIPRARRAKAFAGGLFRAAAPAVEAVIPARLTERWRYFAASNGRIEQAYRAQRGYFMPAELDRLVGPALTEPRRLQSATESLASVEAEMFRPAGRETDEAAVARLETSVYLRSQLLRDLDVMSMAHSLEVRVPFVDHVLLAAVWPTLGHHAGLMPNKRLLHETLRFKLPASTVRRRKQGFVLPFERWLRTDLREFLEDGIRAAGDEGWIQRKSGEAVCEEWRQGRAHWTRPFGLAVLGAFLSSARRSRLPPSLLAAASG